MTIASIRNPNAARVICDDDQPSGWAFDRFVVESFFDGGIIHPQQRSSIRLFSLLKRSTLPAVCHATSAGVITSRHQPGGSQIITDCDAPFYYC